MRDHCDNCRNRHDLCRCGDLVPALKAELERLKAPHAKDCAFLLNGKKPGRWDCDCAASALTKERERAERLTAALKPFASLPMIRESEGVVYSVNDINIMYSDFMNARQALFADENPNDYRFPIDGTYEIEGRKIKAKAGQTIVEAVADASDKKKED